MIPDDKDDRFSGAKSEGYLTVRTEPKKHQITGEAVKMIKDFIYYNLQVPTYREIKKQRAKNKF